MSGVSGVSEEEVRDNNEALIKFCETTGKQRVLMVLKEMVPGGRQ